MSNIIECNACNNTNTICSSCLISIDVYEYIDTVDDMSIYTYDKELANDYEYDQDIPIVIEEELTKAHQRIRKYTRWLMDNEITNVEQDNNINIGEYDE